MGTRQRTWTAVLAGLLALLGSMLLPTVTAPAGASTKSSGAPKSGGTLVFGEVAGITSLDPIHIPGGGTSGGDEAGAVYGYLMRFDSATRKYVPYLAKGLTHNSSETVWTLTLRPGMTFSDGTPFNSAAVLENFQRDMNPANHATAAGLLHLISSVTAPSPTTVVFTLAQPWSGFAYALAYTAGLIAAPSYIAELNAGDTSATPIGAGPFEVSSWQPGVKLLLKPNPSFPLAKPHLGTLEFTFIPGGPATLQAFQSGQLNAALLIDPPSASQAKADKIPSLVTLSDLGNVILMNNRSTSPLSNPKLREAVALAFNDRVYNERVNQGTGPSSDEVYPKGSIWYSPSEKSVPYDLAKAKSLVKQVEAETGWNGTLSMDCANTETSVPVAVESMLQPAGITLKVTDDIPLTTLEIDIIVEKSFDLACWGYAVVDTQPFANLWLQLDSASPNNFAGYSNPRMDAALATLGTAATPAAQKKAMAKVVDIWNSTYPSVNIGTAVWRTIHKPNVHGLDQSIAGIVLFDKAWVS